VEIGFVWKVFRVLLQSHIAKLIAERDEVAEKNSTSSALRPLRQTFTLGRCYHAASLRLATCGQKSFLAPLIRLVFSCAENDEGRCEGQTRARPVAGRRSGPRSWRR